MTRLRLFLEKLGANFQIYTQDQFFDLISTQNHPLHIKQHRALLNIARIRYFSLFFTILLVLWLLLDYLFLAEAPFIVLAVIKCAALAILLMLAWPKPKLSSQLASRLLLSLFLLAFPMIFLSSSYLLPKAMTGKQHPLILQFYASLPYMSVAGLGLFPLTLREALAYAIPLSILALGGWIFFNDFPTLQLLPSIWLLAVVSGLAVISSAMQLQDMISLISRPSYDPVTSALSQRSGIDALAREFQLALLHDDNFAIALIELDEFEKIIKEYDSPTYDRIILETADILREDLRSNDTLTRWNDKVFLITLANTDCAGVKITIDRIRNIGIGTLPDGELVTACIGVAERLRDEVVDWRALLKLAEHRLQQAKQIGKGATRYCGEARQLN